jgi:hypothetical protein
MLVLDTSARKGVWVRIPFWVQISPKYKDFGDMVELVDTPSKGAGVITLVGSSPTIATK